MFARTIGSAVGLAVFGAIANSALAARGVDVGTTPPREALNAAMHQVFLGFVVVGLMMLVPLFLMPRRTTTLAGDAVIKEPSPD